VNLWQVLRFLTALVIIVIVWYALDFSAWFGLELIYKDLEIKPIYREATNIFRSGIASLTDHAIGLLIVSSVFTAIYQLMIRPKKLSNSVIYGLLFGIVAKIDIGTLAYTVHPLIDKAMLISITVAAIQGVVGGLILAILIKE
jgi:hypothetical protein